MSMRFTEIGQQLRAYRLESGLRAEEIAARLGVSRAALYRYEKGEVIKLDTVKRLAELLKISPLSLLGIGVEYYNRPVAYFERLRQLEETADQILQVFGPLCYLTTSDAYDSAVAEAFDEAASEVPGERAALRSQSDQVLGILAARKRMYGLRRPGIICIVPVDAVRRLLELGIAPGLPISERVRRMCRQIAETEVENMAALIEAEPMGLQFGLLTGPAPTSSFVVLRARDRVSLAINPFRPDAQPTAQTGVAMITGADEAIAAHQRVAETSWREALKGAAGANRLRQLLGATALVS
jgi:transcriptional regulator with XRE-family HTH domain